MSRFGVVARCGVGHPLVIRNHPLDREGRPFPTLFWLTCPDAVRAVSRLEADGWIKRLAERAEQEPAFGQELAEAHERHARERGRLASEGEGWGGVAGSPGGVKCLHAHYANHLAGGGDPVGAWVAERVEPVHARGGGGGERLAAVDMGTNSIRLLVAEVRQREEEPVELARDMVITRLGRGVDRTGRLDPASLARTLEVLGWYAWRAKALGVRRIKVGATSAVRDAAEREELFSGVRALTGAEPEVLTGEREAALSFLGATRGLDAPTPYLVLDIGGGSTEAVVGTGSAERAISVDVGSVRITERVAPVDPPHATEVEAMRAAAAAGLAPAFARIPAGSAATLVAVAGTATTVQAIALGLERYDPDAIHRTTLHRRTVEETARRLAAMTTAERAALPVMVPGREDVIVAGVQILLEAMERWGFERCLVSERDILDGLLLEMAALASAE